jgi:hypothetical protein
MDRIHELEEMTMSKEIFDRGLAIRKKVPGAEFVEKFFASADDFNRPISGADQWNAVALITDVPLHRRSEMSCYRPLLPNCPKSQNREFASAE